MPIGDIISITKLCLKIGPAFVLLAIGLRFLFYSPDGWNLDKIYVKYFRGRRKKKYRQFSQRAGFVILLIGLLYTWLVVWPMVEEFFVASPE